MLWELALYLKVHLYLKGSVFVVVVVVIYFNDLGFHDTRVGDSCINFIIKMPKIVSFSKKACVSLIWVKCLILV